MLKPLIFCLISGLFYLSPAGGQTLDSCRNQQSTYGPTPPDIDKNIQLIRSVGVANISAPEKRIASPQKTHWFTEVDPDYANPGKLTTRLYIGSNANQNFVLEAIFRDHGNTFSARWINDKLLFVQVWWGHIASSDLILDVDQDKFIYKEFVNYGQLTEPCR